MGRGGRNGLFLPKKGRDWGRWSMIDFFLHRRGWGLQVKVLQLSGWRGEGRGETVTLLDLRLNI